MKQSSLIKNRFLFIIIAAQCGLVGCTRAIHLAIIDNLNDKPLAGVSVLWREDSAYNIFTQHQRQFGPTNFISRPDGSVTIDQVHEKWASRLIFSRPGYSTVYGIYYRGNLKIAERIMRPPLPQDRFILEGYRSLILSSNGIFVIKMK